MPPEPLPWDRKDFFKERKLERSSESLGSSAVSRWRDAPHHGSSRWGPADFRRPPGGKQGGWNGFSEESGHGFTASRSNDNILDEENCRPSGSRGDGKYCRNSRENKGSFSQKDLKGHSWETAASPNGSSRLVDDFLAYNSQPNSDFANSWDREKIGGASGLVTGQRFERENSLGSIDWKPLKWTRSGSLSSLGSGFSHSSSSKSNGVFPNDLKVDVQPRNVTPLQSPSGDAAACVSSAASPDETSSCKKPRLGWGEGLAKYEKKKVEGPDDTAGKNGMVLCRSNTELLPSYASNMADKSPRLTGFSDCASPATPSSVACSSSPGLEDKSFVKAVNGDSDSCNLSGSPCPVSHNHSERLDCTLEDLELTPIANLSFSVSELLQSDDPSSVDSGFVRSIAVNKLRVLKSGISKELEMTESEIDLLENELKSLISESGSTCPCPAASSSVPVVCNVKPCEELCVASNLNTRPAPLQLPSSGGVIMENIVGALEEEHAEVRDEDIDSPGTATSKFVEPLSLGKSVSPSNTVNHVECLGNLDTCRSENLKVKCSVDGLNEENTCVGSVCGDGIQPIACNSCAALSSNVGLHCDREDKLYDIIVAANKDSANRASGVFNKLLPANQCCIDNSRAASGPCWQNYPLIKEKFARRKRFLRFKERVITLKFRAFQHLWKEDMRLLSIRRCRAKSQKRFELSSRTGHGGFQKHRSSIRSRFSSLAGNLSLVPTTEIINFTSKLLSDSQVKICRNTLKMPALMLDKNEKMISRFISSNGLVEDPCAVEKEKSVINPWTSEEKQIFIDKLATIGKDFSKIASFLVHKTTADCVEFYYKNHKSDCFQKTKKPEFAKQGKSYSNSTYLVTFGKRWNRESNAASLDMLGAASEIAANVGDGIENQQKCMSRFLFGASCDCKAPRGDDGMLDSSNSLDVFGNERETAAADVLAGICGSLSSEAMSSCITSSVDPGDGFQEWKCQKVGSSMRQPLTPEVTQNIDDETCSDESCGEMDLADWTDEEKAIFIQAVASYGKDFATISQCVRTRSRNQCKVFFSKARKCLGLDMMHPGPGNEGKSVNDDSNRGESDTEDACVVETGSVVCSDKSRSNIIENGGVSESLAVQDHANAVIPSDKEAGQNEASGHDILEKAVSTGEVKEPDLPSISGTEVEPKAMGEVSGEHLRVEIDGCSSNVEKPCRNGDVKLFGQILTHGDVKLFGQVLTHPSSQQKPNPSMHENEDNGAQHPKLNDMSINMKFNGNHSVGVNSGTVKFELNNYLGLENLPLRSYGFWDGNRIQTGFPSLPDSAILLAKCPAAFGNFPTTSSKVEQQPLHSVVKAAERNLNGVSVFPTREISGSNGVADYPVYRNRDGTKVQPFTADMKQRQDFFFSGMQRRSEFEAVSSLQQQSRGIVGINVVGRGGIFVGGPCTGVSDPVAAIKMHYAKTEQYSGQAGSIVREEESWRGKGDIDR